MIRSFRKNIRKLLKLLGYELVRIHDRDHPWTPNFIEQEFLEINQKCAPYTITSIEMRYALYKAVEYIVKHGIKGDMVECGVYKGGSTMLMAHTLMKMGESKRKIYLYDTYSGMAKPTDRDIDYMGRPAINDYDYVQYSNKDFSVWSGCPLEVVKDNMLATGYPNENLIFIKGKVEETIPGNIPDKISLLRLDTDWFESSYHELNHLFPRLSVNGVILIDDYGHYKGARQAVDQYFQEENVKILLNRIDYSGRIGVKVDT